MADFAQTLKTWRHRRRFSQLGLALTADVSVRHIAFLETGRARPSAAMVIRLGEALALPLAARNQMLMQAGFAPRYAAHGWDDAAMRPIRAALDHMLTRHAPYPAFALDRAWVVRGMNAPSRRLFGPLGLVEGASLLDLMLSDALPAAVENWAEVATHTVRRLRTESAAQGGAAALDRAADRLSAALPDPPHQPAGPVTPTVLRSPAGRLTLFATIAQFGTPEDVTLDDLKIELWFPGDAATDAALRAQDAAAQA